MSPSAPFLLGAEPTIPPVRLTLFVGGPRLVSNGSGPAEAEPAQPALYAFMAFARLVARTATSVDLVYALAPVGQLPPVNSAPFVAPSTANHVVTSPRSCFVICIISVVSLSVAES